MGRIDGMSPDEDIRGYYSAKSDSSIEQSGTINGRKYSLAQKAAIAIPTVLGILGAIFLAKGIVIVIASVVAGLAISALVKSLLNPSVGVETQVVKPKKSKKPANLEGLSSTHKDKAALRARLAKLLEE